MLEGKYNGVVFHRVIEGFMAQTGDVKYGNSQSSEFNLSLAGTGGSDLPNVNAEFSNIAHERGTFQLHVLPTQIVSIVNFYML